MAYPDGLLTGGERVREHRHPHMRMLVLPALVPPVVVGLGMWLAAVVARRSWHAGAWVALLVVGAVIVGRFALTPLLRWWCTHFVVTDRRLLVREGVLSRSGVDLPAATITDVRTSQRGLERLLGCGTLLVSTRDAADPWAFHGIPHLAHTAARLGTVAEERGGLHRPDTDDRHDPDIEYGDDLDDGDLEYDGRGYDGRGYGDGFEDGDLDEPIEGELVEDDDLSRRARRGAGRTFR